MRESRDRLADNVRRIQPGHGRRMSEGLKGLRQSSRNGYEQDVHKDVQDEEVYNEKDIFRDEPFFGINPKVLQEKIARAMKQIESQQFSLEEDRVILKASYFPPIQPINKDLVSIIHKIRSKNGYPSGLPSISDVADRLMSLNSEELKARFELLCEDIRRELELPPQGDEHHQKDTKHAPGPEELHLPSDSNNSAQVDDLLRVVICFTDQKGDNGEKIIIGSRKGLISKCDAFRKIVEQRVPTKYAEVIKGGTRSSYLFMYEDEKRYNACGLKSYKCFEPTIVKPLIRFLTQNHAHREMRNQDLVIRTVKANIKRVIKSCVTFMDKEKVSKLRALQCKRLHLRDQVKSRLEQQCIESIRDLLDAHFQTMHTEISKIETSFDAMESKIFKYYQAQSKTARVMASRVVSYHLNGLQTHFNAKQAYENEILGEKCLIKMLIMAEDLESSFLYDKVFNIIVNKACTHLFDLGWTCPLLPQHAIRAVLSKISDKQLNQVHDLTTAFLPFVNTTAKGSDLRVAFEKLVYKDEVLRSISDPPDYASIINRLLRARDLPEARGHIRDYDHLKISLDELLAVLTQKLKHVLIRFNQSRNVQLDESGQIDNRVARVIEVTQRAKALDWSSINRGRTRKEKSMDTDPTSINLQALKQVIGVINLKLLAQSEITQRIRIFGIKIRNCNDFPTYQLLKGRGLVGVFAQEYLDAITEEILQRNDDRYTDSVKPIFIPKHIKATTLQSNDRLLDKHTNLAKIHPDHGSSRWIPTGFTLQVTQPFLFATIHADIGFGNLHPSHAIERALKAGLRPRSRAPINKDDKDIKPKSKSKPKANPKTPTRLKPKGTAKDKPKDSNKSETEKSRKKGAKNSRVEALEKSGIGERKPELGMGGASANKPVRVFGKVVENPRVRGKAAGRWFFEVDIVDDDEMLGSVAVGFDLSNVDTPHDERAIRTGMSNTHFLHRSTPVSSFVELQANEDTDTLFGLISAKKMHIKEHVRMREEIIEKKLKSLHPSEPDPFGLPTKASSSQTRMKQSIETDRTSGGLDKTSLLSCHSRQYRASGCMWESNGILHHNARRVSTGMTFGAGDTIGCGIDLNTYSFYFVKNGKLVASSAFQALHNNSLWIHYQIPDESLCKGSRMVSSAKTLDANIMSPRIVSKHDTWPYEDWYDWILDTKQRPSHSGAYETIRNMIDNEDGQHYTTTKTASNVHTETGTGPDSDIDIDNDTDTEISTSKTGCKGIEGKIVQILSSPDSLTYDTVAISDHLREMFQVIWNKQREGMIQQASDQVGNSDVVSSSLVRSIKGIPFPHNNTKYKMNKISTIDSRAFVYSDTTQRRHFSIPMMVEYPEVDSIASVQKTLCSAISTFSSLQCSVTEYEVSHLNENPNNKDTKTGHTDKQRAEIGDNCHDRLFLLRPAVTLFSGHSKPKLRVNMRFQEPFSYPLAGFYAFTEEFSVDAKKPNKQPKEEKRS